MRHLIDWFDEHGRVLPWRTTRQPWGVLVSEVMLQQTPVDRVVPRWQAWMTRWPAPVDLAADSPAEALRVWDRLGYPRRALNLYRAAQTIAAEFDGAVPAEYELLLRLPGVGDYTANAVLAFAYRQRVPVLDTNVRRVHTRVFDGGAQVRSAAPTAFERRRAASLLPEDPEQAAWLGEAWMELGAVVCKARRPSCQACPLAVDCAWHSAGNPDSTTPGPARQAAYDGSHRQMRGNILAVLRASERPVARVDLDLRWDPERVAVAISSLVADGLVATDSRDRISLPSE